MHPPMLDGATNDSEDFLLFANLSEVAPPYDLGPEYHRTVRLCTLGVMFLVSLLGNVMVVRQLLPLRKGRFPKSKVLFLNLAASDLFVTFATMLSQFVWELMDHRWIAGDVACKLFKFLQTYSLCSSTYILVAIALDRFNAIVRPFSPSHRPQCYALAAWGAALLPSLPCLIVFHQVRVADNLDKCVSKFYTHPQAQFWRQTYVLCVFVSAFIAPFVLLLALYVRLVREIRRRSSVFSAAQQTASSLPRARTKTLRMTAAILLAFILLNIPYVVHECFISFGSGELIDRNVAALAGVISASNSAFNPYIYLTFQSQTTCFGRLVHRIAVALRSRRWPSTTDPKMDTSYATYSRTSSRVDVNTVHAAKANGKVEATPV